MEAVVILIKTPSPTLEYTSPYTSSIILLTSTQISAYLLNIFNLDVFNTPKKKGQYKCDYCLMFYFT